MLKKLLPHTLFGRSLLILVTPVILIQVVATYMFFNRHWSVMTDRLAFAVAGEMAVFAANVERGESQANLQKISNDMQKYLDIEIRYKDGQKIETVKREHHDWGSVVAQTMSRAIEQRINRPYDIHIDVAEKWVEISVQLKDGVMIVTSPQNRLFSASARIYIYWVMSTSAILLIIAVMFMRNQIRPIRRLAIAAEKLGKGRDVPFFKPEGAREVRQAAQAFLDMRARIDRQISQRTTMLAGVSHDLRTPLTRMKLQLEMMGDGQDVTDLKSDVADMEKMMSAYLDFVKGLGDEPPQRTDINSLLERVTSSFTRTGAKIECVVKGDLSTILRPIAFERAMMNIIGNAVKYAPMVWVSARKDEDHIVIYIDDNGAGISPEKYDDVFKPFYRIDPSRNPKTGGVGLGLPIAQDIILAHGGTINLEHSPRGGLRVAVGIPV